MKLKSLSLLLLAFLGCSLISCEKNEDEKEGDDIINQETDSLAAVIISLKDSYDGVLDFGLNKTKATIKVNSVSDNLVNLNFTEFKIGDLDFGELIVSNVKLLEENSIVKIDKDSQLVVLDVNKDGMKDDTFYVSVKGEAFLNDSINTMIYVYGIDEFGDSPAPLNFYTGELAPVANDVPVLGGEIWNTFDGVYSGDLTAEGEISSQSITVVKVGGYVVSASIAQFPTPLGAFDINFDNITVVENADGTCSFSGVTKFADLIDVNVSGTAKEMNSIEFEVVYAGSIATFKGTK